MYVSSFIFDVFDSLKYDLQGLRWIYIYDDLSCNSLFGYNLKESQVRFTHGVVCFFYCIFNIYMDD